MNLKTAQKILEKNKQDYQELAEEFSDTRANLWPEFQELAKYVKDNDRILDLGCGNGRLYSLFQGRPIKYVGIDSSAKLIEIAKKNFQFPISNFQTNSKFQALNSKPQFIVADAMDLPFRDNEFDAVFAVALLHHIPSKELRLKVLENCYRVLRPGGILILTVWNLWQPKLILKYKLWKMIFRWFHSPEGEIFGELDWKDIFIPWHARTGAIYRYYHAFCKNELKNLIQKANFEIIDFYYARKDRKTNWLRGFNLIVIAKKIKKR